MLITPHLVRLSRLYVFFIRLFSFSSLPSIPCFPRFLVFFALWFHSCLPVVSSPAFPMRPVNIHSNWVKLALRRGSIMPGLLPFSFPDSTFFFFFSFFGVVVDYSPNTYNLKSGTIFRLRFWL